MQKLTNAQKEYFKDSIIRDEVGNLKTMYNLPNHWLKEDKDKHKAPVFTSDRKRAEANGYEIYYVYLNVKNPVDMDREGKVLLEECFPDKAADPKDSLGQKFRDFLQEKGYDGMTWKEGEDQVTAPIKPNQIKAIDNLYPTKANDFRDNSEQYLRENFNKLTLDEHMKLAKKVKLQNQSKDKKERTRDNRER